MVTTTGKYALRILGYLADRQGEWVQGREIARETGIPSTYLSKILSQLVKSGLARGRKGWGGGFVLASRALRAPIGRALEAVEGPRERDACVFELRKCDRLHPCPLHGQWEGVRERYDTMLRSMTIGDLRTRATS